MRFVASLVVVLASILSVATPTAGAAGTDQTYVVLYRQSAVPSGAADRIADAGGTLVAHYDQIGVVIATSSDQSFRETMLQDHRVSGVTGTSVFATTIELGKPSVPNARTAAAAASDSDTFSPLQWDMQQIQVPQAHAVTSGSRDVLVGDIDTGLDWTHPDLAPNVDFANSVSCVGGVPNQDPAAWADDFGHGTHTAGTIAAAANGIGIVGVAPNVRIAGIKASTTPPNPMFLPEAIICSFMWAGDHHFDVVNNSYVADPWLFNCRNDPDQRVVLQAEQRAIRYAINQGVTVVAAAGNNNIDLRHPGDGNQGCDVVPVEIPGVIGVSSVGSLGLKASYSNYGMGIIQVTAPGGDYFFQQAAGAITGPVLSTWPTALAGSLPPELVVTDCSAGPCATYAYDQGTSMATPHVTGIAALIISQFVESSHGQDRPSPGRIASIINRTADPLACPPNPYDPGGTGEFTARCVGNKRFNSFYGFGQVNALSAVTAK